MSRSVWKKIPSLEKFYTNIVTGVSDYYQVCPPLVWEKFPLNPVYFSEDVPFFVRLSLPLSVSKNQPRIIWYFDEKRTMSSIIQWWQIQRQRLIQLQMHKNFRKSGRICYGTAVNHPFRCLDDCWLHRFILSKPPGCRLINADLHLIQATSAQVIT